jgi:hypothetical protein
MNISDLQKRVLGGKKIFDPDALIYINAVENADVQALEQDVKIAINDFVVGCKDDGNWDAIKSCCILAGARTLLGCLVPLKGAAPTNFNFNSGDYDRKIGLIGNASNKYLNSNRLSNADPETNAHISVFVTEPLSFNRGYIGTSSNVGGSSIYASSSTNIRFFRNSSITASRSATAYTLTGFFGISRISTTVQTRISQITNTISINLAQVAEDIRVFRGPGSFDYSNARISFYSIGESINLALLDARITTLMNDYNIAIL